MCSCPILLLVCVPAHPSTGPRSVSGSSSQVPYCELYAAWLCSPLSRCLPPLNLLLMLPLVFLLPQHTDPRWPHPRWVHPIHPRPHRLLVIPSGVASIRRFCRPRCHLCLQCIHHPTHLYRSRPFLCCGLLPLMQASCFPPLAMPPPPQVVGHALPLKR